MCGKELLKSTLWDMDIASGELFVVNCSTFRYA
jgi:hypothetical protein